MAVKVKTHQELHGKEAPIGYEADMGLTPPGDSAPGRWTVRRGQDNWVVLFHSFRGAEYVIQTFPPTEDGERAAKTMALEILDVVWGRE